MAMDIFHRFYLWVEGIILTRLVPHKNPGVFFKQLFKLPVYMYRMGLGKAIGKRILILTTRGRRTGKLRQTALEYGYDEDTHSYSVMAGWGGTTDWYRNAIAYPRVQIQVGVKKLDAVAERLTEDEVTRMLIEITRINPKAIRIWSRWAVEPIDGSEESLRKASKYFPSLHIRADT